MRTCQCGLVWWSKTEKQCSKCWPKCFLCNVPKLKAQTILHFSRCLCKDCKQECLSHSDDLACKLCETKCRECRTTHRLGADCNPCKKCHKPTFHTGNYCQVCQTKRLMEKEKKCKPHSLNSHCLFCIEVCENCLKGYNNRQGHCPWCVKCAVCLKLKNKRCKYEEYLQDIKSLCKFMVSSPVALQTMIGSLSIIKLNELLKDVRDSHKRLSRRVPTLQAIECLIERQILANQDPRRRRIAFWHALVHAPTTGIASGSCMGEMSKRNKPKPLGVQAPRGFQPILDHSLFEPKVFRQVFALSGIPLPKITHKRHWGEDLAMF